MTHLDPTLALIAEAMTSRSEEESWTTPQRSVGDGGSLGGRGNVRRLRRVVDRLSASVLNAKVDLHKMLGKVEDARDASEFERSANKSMGLSPGANFPSIITLFRSPEVNCKSMAINFLFIGFEHRKASFTIWCPKEFPQGFIK